MINRIGLWATAAATGVLALSTAALAADMPVKAPPRTAAAAVYSWTGFYAGIHGGYGWGDADYAFPVTNIFTSIFPAAGARFDQRLSGGIFGGHLGYNQQVGNLVVGLEASGGWSGLKGSTTLLSTAGPPIVATYPTKLEWYAALTPRVGFAGPNWLMYAKGGLAAGSVISTPNAAFVASSATFSERNAHIGWTVGAGLEYTLTPNWIVGLEYNYIDLGTEHYGGVARTSTGGFERGEFDLRLRYHTVLARLSYKLSAPVAVAAAAIPVKAPVYAASAGPWTGFYAGIHGGYGWGDADYTFPLDGGLGVFAPTPGGAFGQAVKGGVFGGHLGANYQTGNLVVGLEGSLAWSGIKGTSTEVFPIAGTQTYDTKLNWLATVTPRVGYAANNWLIYAKGGLAGGRIDSRLTRIGGQSLVFQEKTDHLGWTAGAGLDYAVAPNWIIGVEYNYVDLGTEKYGGRLIQDGLPASGPEYNVDLKFSTVLARLSYKFGPAPVVARY